MKARVDGRTDRPNEEQNEERKKKNKLKTPNNSNEITPETHLCLAKCRQTSAPENPLVADIGSKRQIAHAIRQAETNEHMEEKRERERERERENPGRTKGARVSV